MTDAQKPDFERAATDTADGNTGVYPNGTQISYAAEARGVNPFLDFIQHQEKLVVLLSTGGTLTSLAEAGSGTLAGNAQMDVWEQIVSRDAKIIGNVIDNKIFRPYLQTLFPGKPIVAHFELGHDSELDPSEMFALAAQAKTAGYVIRQDVLEEETGYALDKDTPPALGVAMNSEKLEVISEKSPLPTNHSPLPTNDSSPDESSATLESLLYTKMVESVVKDLEREEAAKNTQPAPDDSSSDETEEEEDDYVPLTPEEIQELAGPGWHLATEEDEA